MWLATVSAPTCWAALDMQSSIWATVSNSSSSSGTVDAGLYRPQWMCSSIRASILHSLTTIRCAKCSIDCWWLYAHRRAEFDATFGPQVSLRKGYRQALIEASIVTNAALGAYSIQQEMTTQSALRAVYGVYLLETRKVWAPRLGYPEGDGLAAAPRDLAAFQELGDATVHSSRLMALLGDGTEVDGTRR